MASIPAVRLVIGDEELLAERAVAEVVTAVRAVDPGAQVHRAAGGDLTTGELAIYTSPTLFGGGAVVVVEAAQDAKKDLAAALLEYAAAPAPDVHLVAVHVGGNKGKALADGLRKAGAEVVTVAKIKRPAERAAFVKEELRRLGARVNAAAAEALITAVGHDLRELAAACSQLVADTGGKITTEEVNKYYRGRAEVTGFAVADATVAGDLAAALGGLRWALSIGLDPVPLADALATGVRNVAKVAGARGSSFQLASTLGMAPWQVEKAQQQAHGWSPDGLVTAMQVAADLNAAVKGGAEDRAYALERAIVAIGRARNTTAG
jgi:DNA polymerase-3 subunit delta